MFNISIKIFFPLIYIFFITLFVTFLLLFFYHFFLRRLLLLTFLINHKILHFSLCPNTSLLHFLILTFLQVDSSYFLGIFLFHINILLIYNIHIFIIAFFSFFILLIICNLSQMLISYLSLNCFNLLLLFILAHSLFLLFIHFTCIFLLIKSSMRASIYLLYFFIILTPSYLIIKCLLFHIFFSFTFDI